MGFRQAWVREQARRDKLAGRAANIFGDVFHVLPGSSATHLDHARKLHSKVYSTVAEALAECVSGRGDAIVLWPGTHTVQTTSLAMSKADVTLMGPEAWVGLDRPGMMSRAILTTDIAGDEIMNVTAQGCALVGVTLRPITQSDALDLSAAADYFRMLNCYVDLFTPAVHVNTIGLTLAAAENIVIDGCTFHSDGAQGNAIVATGAIDSYIQNCRIFNTAGTWASAILCGAATTGLHILDSLITSYGTALTAGVNGTGATIASGVQVVRCQFGSFVTVPVDNFDAGECELSENYQLGVGAMDGGALITAIT